MARIKDWAQKESPHFIEPGLLEDQKSFVLNWLQDTPRMSKPHDTTSEEISTRLEDILDELHGDNGHATMKIRLR